MFFDHSEWPDYNDKARQTTLETHAKIARAFGATALPPRSVTSGSPDRRPSTNITSN